MSIENERGSTDDFIARLQNAHTCDSAAETDLYQEFVGRLVRLATRRINSRFQAKVDPMEVVQSVFASFFSQKRNG